MFWKRGRADRRGSKRRGADRGGAQAGAESGGGCAEAGPREEARGCPRCDAGVAHWVPIRYGAVGELVRAQARRGEVVLGGVNHGRNEPGWHCTRCLTDFGRPREDRDRFGRPLGGADPGGDPGGDPRPRSRADRPLPGIRHLPPRLRLLPASEAA